MIFSPALIPRSDFVNHTYDPTAIAGLTVQKQFAEKWKSLDPEASITVTSSIEEALETVKAMAKADEKEAETSIQAFITGSLHLVGGALGVLEGATTL